MLLPESNISAETNGMLMEQAFGVGDLGMIFDILRTKIYKDPIKAICREIASNARDAHREVGTPDRPIEIYLPTAFDLNYKIKDYGPGISPTRMADVFTKYAASTKRQDNIQTGGFGLGCKTPFAYSDNFTVVTVVDGTRRTYIAFIDETKVGKISLAESVSTDEPNGTTIIIPVTSGDEYKFKNATKIAVEYWDVRPEFFGDEIEFKEQEDIASGADWVLRKARTDRYGWSCNNDPVVIVDGIRYDLDASSLDGLTKEERSALSGNGFVLSFGVGELDLAASRDNIQYSPGTQKLIINIFRRALCELTDTISAKIKSATTFVEACKLYNETIENIRGWSLEGALDESVKWNGHKLYRELTILDIGNWARLTVYAKEYSRIVSRTRRSSKIKFMDAGDDLFIFKNDRTQERVDKRLVEHIFSTNPDLEKIQIISTPQKPSCADYRHEVDYGRTPKVEYKHDLLDLIGARSLADVQMPRKVRGAAVGTRRKGSLRGYELSPVGNRIHGEPISVLNKDGGVYIFADFKRKLFVTENMRVSGRHIETFSEFIGQTIYGFSNAKLEKLDKTKWKTLKQAVLDKIAETESTISVKDLNEACKESNWYFKTHMKFNTDLCRKVIQLNANGGLLAKYYKRSEEVFNLLQKHKTYIGILQKMEKIAWPPRWSFDRYSTESNRKDDSELRTMYLDVIKRYPLLKQIDTYYIDDGGQEAVIDYINLIDNNLAASDDSKGDDAAANLFPLTQDWDMQLSA